MTDLPVIVIILNVLDKRAQSNVYVAQMCNGNVYAYNFSKKKVYAYT
jgi:hypothetical protein